MATINNTIYPPLLPTYQKAFLKDSGSKVLFNIQFDVSEYTTITDIQTIEVKVETINGNVSILKGDYYFISADKIIDPITRTGSIDILRTDIATDINGDTDLTIGEFYVIQLRMTEKKYEGKNGDSDEARAAQQDFASTNAEEFSEWSTMSMIKCIDTPYLDLMNGQIRMSQTNRVNDMSDMLGYLQWKNKDTSEYLYSYRFRVYDVDDLAKINKKDYDTIFSTVTPIEDSGDIRPSKESPNRLKYVFRTDFQDIKRYRMYVSYETDNEYTATEYFNFYIQSFISSSNLANAEAALIAVTNNEKEEIDLTLSLKSSYLNVPSKYLVFRRASSESDFKLWDDIHTVKLNDDNVIRPEDQQNIIQYKWIDWTAKSGVFYKYCVQEVDLVDNRAEKIIADCYRYEEYDESVMDFKENESVKKKDYVILDVDYMYLIDKDNTWKLSLDSTVSSITKNRKDTITETLNSKYPFIYRSGKIEYDSYNLEGTISIQGDMYTKFNTVDLIDSLTNLSIEDRIKLHGLDNIFANKKTLLNFDDVYTAYEAYSEEHHLNLQNDYNIERMFREKVEDFLTNGNPKLFRNSSIGNKIVMLTEVSVSPKDGTNNMVYTFSATMTELDDDTVENYDFYRIIDLNKWYLEATKDKDASLNGDKIIGQYSYHPSQIKTSVIDVFEKIKEKYEVQTHNILRSVNDIYKIKIDLSALTEPLIEDSDVLGKAVINEKDFYISKNYPFLVLDNVDITTFTLEVDTANENKVVIDYLIKIKQQLMYSTEGWVPTADKHLGQIYKLYGENGDSDIYKDIYYKYYYKDDKSEKKIANISKLLIQAYSDKDELTPLPNVEILIKDKKTEEDKDDIAYIHVTDKKGIIDLYDEDRVINQIKLKGIKVTETKALTNLAINEYNTIDPNIYTTEEELFNMHNPNENILYQVGKMNLTFFDSNDMGNANELDYTATLENDTLNITVHADDSNASEIETFIKNRLGNEGIADLALSKDDTDKYIYIKGKFYKLDKEGSIILPVWLKVTYLFEYLVKKKVK